MGKLMGLFFMENYLLTLWDCLSLLHWTGALLLPSVAKIVSKKIGVLIHSKKFPSSNVALYL